MRKLLFLLLLVPVVTFAQSTTVSGTITDLGGQTWNNGTYTFTFVANPLFPNPAQYTWTGGALTTTFSGTMNGAGAYSQSIPSSTSITPPGSTWGIQFCPLATAPCFSIPTITITGGTQTVNAAPPAIHINLLNPQPGGNIVAYSVTEIVGAQVGSQYYLVGTGLQVCSTASGNNCTVWNSVGSATNSAPNLSPWYFSSTCGSQINCTVIHDDVVILTDCTTVNTSSTVTCPDAVFKGSDVGKTAWAASLGTSNLQEINATIACPITTIGTFNSSTSITLATANDCTASLTGTAAFFYGTRDGTTIKNAMSAQCANFIFPSGSASAVPGVAKIMVDQPFGNTLASPCNAPFISMTGSVASTSSVVFVITPDFNWSGCTGNNGKISNVCFGSQSINSSYLSFAGYGINGTGSCTSAGSHTVFAGIGSVVNQNWYLNLNGICPGTGGLVGYELDAADSMVAYGGAVHVGQFSCQMNGIALSGFYNDCVNDGSTVTGNGCSSGIGVCAGLLVKSGAIYQSFGDTFLENVQNQGTLQSHGSTFYSSSGNYALTTACNGCTARHTSDGDFFNGTNTPSVSGSFGVNADFGSVVYYHNSTISAGATGTAINLAADGSANTFFDQCGNTYSGGTILNIASGGGQIIGEGCSANATLVTAAKTVLSAGWGSTAAVTALSGSDAPIQFTITNSGTGQAASPTITYTFPTAYLVAPFSCTATQIGGTNASLNPFTSSSLSKTGVTFTATGTPTASSTEIMQVTCVTP